MTTIVIAIAAFGLLVVLAVVVGIVDRVQAPVWRWIAAERHENWERRQHPEPIHRIPHRDAA